MGKIEGELGLRGGFVYMLAARSARSRERNLNFIERNSEPFRNLEKRCFRIDHDATTVKSKIPSNRLKHQQLTYHIADFSAGRRFGEIPSAAGFVAFLPIAGHGKRRQGNDRYLRASRSGANFSRDRKAISPRQIDIHQNQSGNFFFERGPNLFGIEGGAKAVPIPEIGCDEPLRLDIVFDNENMRKGIVSRVIRGTTLGRSHLRGTWNKMPWRGIGGWLEDRLPPLLVLFLAFLFEDNGRTAPCN